MIKFYRDGITKNIVPLMLCVSIVTSCMYVYSRTYLALFFIVTLVIQTTVFSFYSYISEKSVLLRFISIVGSFLAIAGMVTIAIRTGNNKSSMDYFIWFLSPQALVDFSFAYISATFIIINFFIASTVYYFSAVRYRISMTFLITLIPFAVYRKEGEDVPVFFALLLLAMYMALMIHCRQINTKKRQKMVVDRGYKRSITVFLAFNAFMALILPKPQIGFDNSWVDTVFESEKITEYMLERLGIMSETATSSAAYTKAADIKLYEFLSQETPLNLKSQTFSSYNFDKNKWTAEADERKGEILNEDAVKLLDPAALCSAAAAAADADADFAEKYDIEKLSPVKEGINIKSVTMLESFVPSVFYYSPALAFSVAGSSVDVMRTSQGTLYSPKPFDKSYIVRYYTDQLTVNKNIIKLVSSLNMENFGEFLGDMRRVLDENGIDGYSDLIVAYADDFNSAVNYLSDYADEYPEAVYRITENAVRKNRSDYEKACAIESYFERNDFTYSLSYRKPYGYNMEYFLTEGKTGICSDYATAMVLMARAAGIPARYAEGIHLHDPDENGITTVYDSDLHAYPELYISGYGWMAFEPTSLSNTGRKPDFDFRMSVLLGIAAFLIILFILFYDRIIYPYISEKIFMFRIKKMSDEKTVEAVFVRLRKRLGLDNSMTSAQTGKYVREVYGTDMSMTVEDFDRAVYGGEKTGTEARERAVALYLELTGRKTDK